ncbi:MAG: hypothetical protein MI757_20880 [Pirellulales bacterium]|nr:hypothetical protein [Pirellulales bacterium]
MSLFDNNLYQWRETYFVYFREKDRPSLEIVEKCLKASGQRTRIEDGRADADGKFESITIYAPDSNSAMDVACVADEEVAEACENLITEMTGEAGIDEPEKLAKLDGCDIRLEVMHFEEMVEYPDLDVDEMEEMLEPTALLGVLGALAEACKGVAVDPQTGTFP